MASSEQLTHLTWRRFGRGSNGGGIGGRGWRAVFVGLLGSEEIETGIGILDVFLVRRWVSSCEAVLVRAASSRTNGRCRSRNRCCGLAAHDEPDLVFAIDHRPVSTARANDICLFQQRALVPRDADLADLLLLIEEDDMSLLRSASGTLPEAGHTYDGNGSDLVSHEILEAR